MAGKDLGLFADSRKPMLLTKMTSNWPSLSWALVRLRVDDDLGFEAFHSGSPAGEKEEGSFSRITMCRSTRPGRRRPRRLLPRREGREETRRAQSRRPGFPPLFPLPKASPRSNGKTGPRIFGHTPGSCSRKEG